MRFLLAFLLSFAAHFLWIANGSFSFAAEAPPRVLEVQIQAPKPLPKETKSVLSAQPKTADKNKVEHAEKSDNSNALTAISTTQNELLASVDLAENPSANELADVITKAEAQASNLSDNLPTHGSIFYRVDYGPDENRTEVGRAENRFLVEGQNYKLISIMETVGLAALLKPLRIEMESVGVLTAQGLQPTYFEIRQKGKEIKEKAAFDWAAKSVIVGNNAPENLNAGAQDLLSFTWQLGLMPNLKNGIHIQVATGKKLNSYPVEFVGEETIELPAGAFLTLHFRASGEKTTEVWLASEYLLLPIKIRHTDQKGEIVTQVATKIDLP